MALPPHREGKDILGWAGEVSWTGRLARRAHEDDDMKDLGVYLFFAAVTVCCMGLVWSCSDECSKRGGVLVQGAVGFVCVPGAR